jgi:hypothetical protein
MSICMSRERERSERERLGERHSVCVLGDVSLTRGRKQSERFGGEIERERVCERETGRERNLKDISVLSKVIYEVYSE